MRSYPHNSPQAAACIVSMVALADGHVCGTEMARLDRLGAATALGLQPGELRAVMRGYCEDLLATSASSWTQAARLEPTTVSALMAEIDDPELRRKVARLCVALVEADARVVDSEWAVLAAALDHWGLSRHAATEGAAVSPGRR